MQRRGRFRSLVEGGFVYVGECWLKGGDIAKLWHTVGGVLGPWCKGVGVAELRNYVSPLGYYADG